VLLAYGMGEARLTHPSSFQLSSSLKSVSMILRMSLSVPCAKADHEHL
jgi:hypothetical protein